MPRTKTKEQKDKGLTGAIVFAAVIIAGALIFLGTQISKNNSPGAIQQEQPVYLTTGDVVEGDHAGDSPFIGNPDAPVTLVEFSDLECGFCKRHHEDVFPKIKEAYVDTGLVKYVVRDLPLSIHGQWAVVDALAANCARELGGNEKYFEYSDLIFTNTRSNGDGLESEEMLYDLAEQIGLNRDEFLSCVQGQEYVSKIQEDVNYAREIKIGGTPGFFVNDTYIDGAEDFETFSAIIESYLPTTDGS